MAEKIVVIGGGIGGVEAIIALAEDLQKNKGKQRELILIEKAEELLLGSSNKTPGRLGGGFHYKDKATAIAYLYLTIAFIRRYQNVVPNFFIGQEHVDKVELDHPILRGCYYIINESINSKDSILETYQALKEEYTRMCQEDPDNQVLGPPEKYYELLPSDGNEPFLDRSKIQKGVSTAERLMNWPAVRTYLLNRVNDLQKEGLLQVSRNCELVGVKKESEFGPYRLQVNRKNDKGEFNREEILAHTVINSTWERAQQVDIMAGHIAHQETNDGIDPRILRTNRVKVIVKGSLPADMAGQFYSRFFCMSLEKGAMISVMDDEGTFYATFTGVTNITKEINLIPSETIQQYLGTTADTAPVFWDRISKEEYGKKILEGLSQYIPGVERSKIKRVGFGNVLTPGHVSFSDPTSVVHKRDHSGVDLRYPLGWITVCSKKLVEALQNAKRIVAAVDEIGTIKQQKLDEYADKLVGFSSEYGLNLTDDLRALYKHYLQLYFTHAELVGSDVFNKVAYSKMSETILKKTEFLTSFKKAVLEDQGVVFLQKNKKLVVNSSLNGLERRTRSGSFTAEDIEHIVEEKIEERLKEGVHSGGSPRDNESNQAPAVANNGVVIREQQLMKFFFLYALFECVKSSPASALMFFIGLAFVACRFPTKLANMLNFATVKLAEVNTAMSQSTQAQQAAVGFFTETIRRVSNSGEELSEQERRQSELPSTI